MKELYDGRMAVYSRKSRFTGKGESIENQIELCRQYIRQNFGEEQAEECLLYEDEGFSGGNLERPMFRQMMRDARAGQFSAVVVYRLDRISRNTGDFAGLIESLSDMKIAFISIKEQFDTTSPMGRAMMYIASVFSQLERETIAERIRDNMHELAKTGRWLGGTTPTGYESEEVYQAAAEGKSKKSCRLKSVPEEAAMVKDIFLKFLETESLALTKEYIDSCGYRTKKENSFTRFSIREILSNPVYMKADEAAYEYMKENGAEVSAGQEGFDGAHGVMAYNRTFQKTGKAHENRQIKEWIVAIGAHEGLIQGEDWRRVQKLLLKNRRRGSKKGQENTSLLSEILFCGVCGCPMRSKLKPGYDEKGNRCFSYICTAREKKEPAACSLRNLNGALLDAELVEALGQLSEDENTFKSRLNREKKEYRSKLRTKPPLSEEELSAVLSRLTFLPDLFAETGIKSRRSLLRHLTERIVWDGQNAHIYFSNIEKYAIDNK